LSRREKNCDQLDEKNRKPKGGEPKYRFRLSDRSPVPSGKKPGPAPKIIRGKQRTRIPSLKDGQRPQEGKEQQALWVGFLWHCREGGPFVLGEVNHSRQMKGKLAAVRGGRKWCRGGDGPPKGMSLRFRRNVAFRKSQLQVLPDTYVVPVAGRTSGKEAEQGVKECTNS